MRPEAITPLISFSYFLPEMEESVDMLPNGASEAISGVQSPRASAPARDERDDDDSDASSISEADGEGLTEIQIQRYAALIKLFKAELVQRYIKPIFIEISSYT